MLFITSTFGGAVTGGGGGEGVFGAVPRVAEGLLDALPDKPLVDEPLVDEPLVDEPDIILF